MPEPVEDLILLGISDQKAKETLKNKQLTELLVEITNQARKINDDFLKTENAHLLYQVGTRLKPQFKKFLPLLIENVCNGNLKTETQVSAALDFVAHRTVSGFSVEEFAEACGIGVVVTADEMERTVENVFTQYKDEIVSERYRFNTGKIVREVKQQLKWADGKVVKNEIDLQMLNLLGPKNSDDLTLPQKKAGKKAKDAENAPATAKSKKESNSQLSAKPDTEGSPDDELQRIEDLLKRLPLHKPGENFRTDGYVTTENTQKLLECHLKATGGKVVTRFPPEPNGILHIGHAKAININFGYAKVNEGMCYLRYDDTNPEKEEEAFVRAIKDVVEWLGYKPYKITHSSDYFDQLYNLAVKLIKSGNAYVCHQKQEDIKGFNPPPSPWRNRSVAENLALFENMKNGIFDEGAATLRMKVTLEEGKQDPVAYRIKFLNHHRTGDKWCIYPTYDYTHCLCDSFENISHSLCTKEFQSRRSSYYWLCNALGIYCPVQWEYSRLNMNYTLVSKRKILKLITSGIVSGWDDPRLFTLTALRRRGFPAAAVNTFVARMGVSVAQTAVDPHSLEAAVRDVLNLTAPRAMAVLEPVEVEADLGESGFDCPGDVFVPNFPGQHDKGKHIVPFAKRFWIDASDFMNGKAEKGYRRLALDQPVGLKHVNMVLSVKKVEKSGNNTLKIIGQLDPVSPENKPKGFIQWVADPILAEVRLYERLFRHKNPEDIDEVPGGFLSDINENSVKVIESAMVDRSVGMGQIYDCFQFERIGYFSVDPDTKPGEKLVFNRTVGLKEDAGMKAS